jgi:hypothetical protein
MNKKKKEHILSREDYLWYREYRKKYAWEIIERKRFDKKRWK